SRDQMGNGWWRPWSEVEPPRNRDGTWDGFYREKVGSPPPVPHLRICSRPPRCRRLSLQFEGTWPVGAGESWGEAYSENRKSFCFHASFHRDRQSRSPNAA